MITQKLIEILIAIAILIVFIVAVILKLRSNSSKKSLVNDFLSGLEDSFTETITTIIKSTNPADYKSLEEFETYILQKIYSDTWDYTESQAKEAFEDDKIASTILSVIDKNTVVKFIDVILNKINAPEMIQDAYISSSNESIEAEDKAAEEKYSNQDEYVENSDNNDLPAVQNEVPTEEEVKKLNPQSDEDEEFNAEDDSMEVITDKTEIITATDKNGNTLYYEITADGKKKRVSKSYALNNM